MCRLYGFLANELTKVECSLVHAQNALLIQSRGDATGRTHADGWGIACYGDPEKAGSEFPELVRHKTAAFNDTQFGLKAESMYARAVVAHVRLATVGYVGSLNSHPFTHDHWSFAHNGTVTGFDAIAPLLISETGDLQGGRLGGTDSEQLFLWLLSHLQRQGIDLASPNPAKVIQTVAELVGVLAERCSRAAPDHPPKLTFVLTNGRFLVANCWNNPLHKLERRGVHDCEICGIPHIRHEDTREYRAAVFGSEPITEEPWIELPNYSLTFVSQELESTTIELSATPSVPRAPTVNSSRLPKI